MGLGSTYAFKSLTGVITNTPLGITIPLQGGNIGAGAFHVRMSTERTVHDIAADSTVMVSYVAGDNGAIDAEMQQSSSLHQDVLALYNLLLLAANGGDVSAWAATTISFRLLSDGSQHIASGVSFNKFPDKAYQATGQRV